jgi:hypothetical protein
MVELSNMKPEQIADKVAKEIEKISNKYNVEIGVWLTWRDMEANLSKMREIKGFDEANFGVQIRFKDVKIQD